MKYLLINEIVKKYDLKNKISYLCNLLEVSRSGYYAYFSVEREQKRNKKNQKDEELRNNILKAYKFKNRKKGARQIKMTLEKEFNIVYNLKRIRRIMKKYNIVCPIRKVNPYKQMIKATKEHSVVPNLLNRNFKQKIPYKVLLTDITYLFYGNGQKAYLSTIKDASTNEIIAYNVSKSLQLDIALITLELLKKNKVSLPKGAFIHSDQGVH